jgi:hypothetical protein
MIAAANAPAQATRSSGFLAIAIFKPLSRTTSVAIPTGWSNSTISGIRVPPRQST